MSVSKQETMETRTLNQLVCSRNPIMHGTLVRVVLREPEPKPNNDVN